VTRGARRRATQQPARLLIFSVGPLHVVVASRGCMESDTNNGVE